MNKRLMEIIEEKAMTKKEISRLTSKLSKLNKEWKNIKKEMRKQQEER